MQLHAEQTVGSFHRSSNGSPEHASEQITRPHGLIVAKQEPGEHEDAACGVKDGEDEDVPGGPALGPVGGDVYRVPPAEQRGVLLLQDGLRVRLIEGARSTLPARHMSSQATFNAHLSLLVQHR